MTIRADMPRAELYATRCTLDTTSIVLPVDRRLVNACVAAYPGIELSSRRDARRHGVWVELARVRDGRADLDAVRRAVGSPNRSPFASWFRLVEPMLDSFNAALSRPFGTYHELMVGIRDVRIRTLGRETFTLVLGMYTDSPIALFGDRALRFGYNKSLARIVRSALGDFEVSDGSGRRLLATASEERDAPAHPDVQKGIVRALRWWSQPLLGYLGRGEYAISEFVRTLGPGTTLRAGATTIEVEMNSLLGLPSGRYAIARASTRDFGVCRALGVEARLTYPRHVRL